MRVFMLGWEFPPYISGGLGTACYGLTRALSRRATDITFVLPKAVTPEQSRHLRLLSPSQRFAASGSTAGTTAAPAGPPTFVSSDPLAKVSFKAVPSRITSPYVGSAAARWANLPRATDRPAGSSTRGSSVLATTTADTGTLAPGPGGEYQGDLMADARRYARLCAELARSEQFDVVHAHDWLTFPAGMAVAAQSGKPLVVHVHSTEFDRAGDNINQQIYDIERRGMHAAVRVIAVSHLTRSIIEKRYAVDPDRIDVVYNGIDRDGTSVQQFDGRIRANDKIVLFLGRITMQKGPEYFVAAARKVLEKIDRVKFVMAGSGDKITDVIELAAREGIGHKFSFTGFLRGSDVDRIYQMADVYVMPSVSEPFGIAALEAVRHDVPVIVSRTSGVSEVLKHALKVDFWDTDDMANKIIALLTRPPLASTLRQHADLEVRRLTWDDAATRCQDVYQQAIATMPK